MFADGWDYALPKFAAVCISVRGLTVVPNVWQINLKGLDGIQGPVYVGTGCVFRRQALYGYEPQIKDKKKTQNCNCFAQMCSLCCGGKSRKGKKSKGKKSDQKKPPARSDSTIPIFNLEDIEEGIEGIGAVWTFVSVAMMVDLRLSVVDGEHHMLFTVAGLDDEKSSLMSMKNFEKRFGQSPVLVASTLLENGGVPHTSSPGSLLKEAIHVISCGYEDKSDWGKEVRLCPIST